MNNLLYLRPFLSFFFSSKFYIVNLKLVLVSAIDRYCSLLVHSLLTFYVDYLRPQVIYKASSIRIISISSSKCSSADSSSGEASSSTFSFVSLFIIMAASGNSQEGNLILDISCL